MKKESGKTVRCAIYTRVSSDSGLEQDFNSLDAQHEASQAYIKSQAHAGWTLIRARYDDGGYSGGSTERPALQRLLEDVKARRVDIIVVYKVDRLTRSLADFAKLVELFDAHGVSFVSVTQQFNTTTSMGRLTLNVLLSFAQFEREVISDFGMSEPEFLISVMDRHTDWCTVVCLVGGGQEINSGEAGLLEWLAALKKRFPRWRVYTSPQLTHRDYHWGDDLPAMIASHAHESLGELHLAVSVRSFRAEALSAFVGALIAGEPAEARDLYASIRKQYPIAITRDLSEARAWLRKQARGTERFGLVASSGASRLKAEGVNVHEKIGATYWFLNDKTDVRSSYYLEDPATEFDVQGLELDWVAVCWDADLRRADSEWSYHKFRGTVWQRVNNPSHRTYLANAYRVLLTRARQGMIIYVPRGDAEDATRPPNFYNGIYAYLQECGLAPVS